MAQNNFTPIKEIAVGRAADPPILSPSGKFLYVLGNEDNAVYVINTKTNQLVHIITVDLPISKDDGCPHNYCRGEGVTAIAISPDERYVYMSSMVKDAVTVYDLKNKKVIKHITVGRFPRDIVITRDGLQGFVINSVDNTLSVLDLKKFSEHKKISLHGGNANGMCFGRPLLMWLGKHDHHLFIQNNLTNTLEMFAHKSLSLKSATPSDGLIEGVLVSNSRQQFWAWGREHFYEINLNKLENTADIEPIHQKKFCKVDRWRLSALASNGQWIAMSNERKLFVLDSESWMPVAFYDLNFEPRGLVFSADSKSIYVLQSSFNKEESSKLLLIDVKPNLLTPEDIKKTGGLFCK